MITTTTIQTAESSNIAGATQDFSFCRGGKSICLPAIAAPS
jgi:hypothetical protein